jgi:signal transduction histidine kinase
MHVRYPIWVKIFLGGLLSTFVLIAAALLYHQNLNSLGQSASQILSQNYKSIRAAEQARKTIEETRNLLLEQVSQNQHSTLIIPDTLDRINAPLNTCKENITEVGEGELIERILSDFSQYKKTLQKLSEADTEIWHSQSFADLLKQSAVLIQGLDHLVEINEAAMERADQETQHLAAQAQRNGALLFAVAIITMLVLSSLLSYGIARPIMELARSLSKTKEGRGEYPQLAVRSKDEVGFLTGAFNRLFRRLEHYDHYRDDILATEREKVRRAEEAKGRFIADISHQLKTPMTSLAMSVSMLRERGEELESVKRTKLFETAKDDCLRLSSLINELVDVSRLEAMALPRPKETIDIYELIRESLAPLFKQAEEKQLVLEVDTPKGLPPVTIDSFRFPWVITNLVGNALRHTEKGGIVSLKVRKVGSRFYFECIDTGSGIDPCYLPHIFDRYTQFSEREKCGTIGLGLAIVKDIIEQHNGDIQVESHLGKGTKFTFWIPNPSGGTI